MPTSTPSRWRYHGGRARVATDRRAPLVSGTEPARPTLIVDFGLLLYIGHFGAVPSHDCAGTVVALGLDDDFALTTRQRVERVRVAVVPSGVVRAVDGGGTRMAVGVVDPDLRVQATPDDATLLEAAHSVAAGGTQANWTAFRRALGLSSRMVTSDSRVASVAASLRAASDDIVLVTELARQVGLSASRLEHLFTEHVGCPIRSFRTWCRFRTVAETVGAGGNITTAAHAAGFHDSAHLTHAFRQSFGLPPSAVLTPDLDVRVIGQDSSSVATRKLHE
jgi:AraC-like DNA-binding protein